MSVYFLSLMIVCQAARMDPIANDDLFEAEVEELNLPDIADRADVDFWTPEAWQGLEQLSLSDFEDNNKLIIIQQHEQFAVFMQIMMSYFSQFASANKVEDKMSLVLKWHLAKLNFFQNFGEDAGADEDCNLHMFLMSQAVQRYPNFLSAFQNFRTQILNIQEDMENAQVQWDTVEIPQRFVGQGLDVVYSWGVVHMADNVIEQWMPELTTNILIAFRNRVVQRVQAYEIPNDLILAASRQRNWQAELQKLTMVQIRQTFLPVWQANGNVDKQLALQNFTWFLINTRFETNEKVLLVMTDVIVNQQDREALMQYAHLGNRAKEHKAIIFDMFINQALNLVAVDNGKFLAGLIYSIWMIKGDRFNQSSNLYKRSLRHFGRSSWRQFIQEKLLGKSNDDEHVKEILKQLLEAVSNVNRNAPKQQFRGSNVSQRLLQFFL
jgi:hypothetical protein